MFGAVMAIRASFVVDYHQFTEMKDRILRIGHMRDRAAKAAADFILREAILNAPHAPHGANQLRLSGNSKRVGDATYEITFTRSVQRSDYVFDVALWLHEPWLFTRTSYTPSDPSPRIGPRYLSRAFEDNEGRIPGEFSLLLEDYLR